MNPYTYLVKCNSINKVYYGVRWGNKKNPNDDLWKDYFTSSKVIKKLIQEYGKEDFSFEVRRIFNDKKEAILWEETVLRRMNILYNQDTWINKCVSKAIRYSVHPLKGKKHSLTTIKKISDSKKGSKISEAVKNKMSISRSGKNHWNYGKSHKEESLLKNKNSNLNTWRRKMKDESLMKQHIEKSIKNNCRRWIILTPENKEIEIENLNKFCRDNNLNPSNMLQNGKHKNYKLIKKILDK